MKRFISLLIFSFTLTRAMQSPGKTELNPLNYCPKFNQFLKEKLKVVEKNPLKLHENLRTLININESSEQVFECNLKYFRLKLRPKKLAQYYKILYSYFNNLTEINVIAAKNENTAEKIHFIKNENLFSLIKLHKTKGYYHELYNDESNCKVKDNMRDFCNCLIQAIKQADIDNINGINNLSTRIDQISDYFINRVSFTVAKGAVVKFYKNYADDLNTRLRIIINIHKELLKVLAEIVRSDEKIIESYDKVQIQNQMVDINRKLFYLLSYNIFILKSNCLNKKFNFKKIFVESDSLRQWPLEILNTIITGV